MGHLRASSIIASGHEVLQKFTGSAKRTISPNISSDHLLTGERRDPNITSIRSVHMNFAGSNYAYSSMLIGFPSSDVGLLRTSGAIASDGEVLQESTGSAKRTIYPNISSDRLLPAWICSGWFDVGEFYWK